MIEIHDVTKVYGKGKPAVSHINLTIENGEIFGFLGPNGAGKTTTLKMMTGISPITEGSITIDGFDITKQSLKAKQQFGFVPDSPDVLLRLKGIEYLNFIASIYNVEHTDAEERISSLAKRFEIQDALSDKISSYSHGMRQKLMMIGVLLHQPANWILDEPLTGLDPKSAFTLKEMMREHADAGNTVLFSTHVLDVAEKVCDRIGILSHGKLVFVGTIEELKKQTAKDESLEELFLELTSHE